MSSSETESDGEPKKKRTCNPTKYKRNVIKNSKVKGQAHTNYRGKQIAPRSTGENCRCKKECFANFNQDDMDFCISKMNCFSTENEQDIFLQTLIDKSDIKQRRPRKENATQRQNAFQFYVLKQTDKVKVCKKAFISLYGITEARVRRLCDLLNEGKIPIDKRGCHPKANTVPPEICQKIHEHILSFPRKKTHYAGKDIDYLDARLDVKKMHLMFNEKYPDLNVKYKFYLQYFNENFSLRFGRPQVDTCITCEELSTKIKQSNLSENAKRSVVAQLMIHKRRAKKFYNKISSVQDLCKERDDVAAITFDFIQNLPLPHIPIQNIFYLRQLWVNCFGIKDLKTGKSTFYMYHEGIANKGANEDQKKLFAPSTYMSFQYDSDRKGTIIAEEYIDGLIKHSFSLIKKIITSISLPSTKAYDLKVPINKKKIDDLKQVEDSILEEHMPFYNNIFSWPTAIVENNPDENDGEYDYVP
ncbi:hypothetical protein ACJJTC_014059 [Scirpophaga incertulas]